MGTRLDRTLHCANLCKYANIHLAMLKCMKYDCVVSHVAKRGGAKGTRQYGWRMVARDRLTIDFS